MESLSCFIDTRCLFQTYLHDALAKTYRDHCTTHIHACKVFHCGMTNVLQGKRYSIFQEGKCTNEIQLTKALGAVSVSSIILAAAEQHDVGEMCNIATQISGLCCFLVIRNDGKEVFCFKGSLCVLPCYVSCDSIGCYCITTTNRTIQGSESTLFERVTTDKMMHLNAGGILQYHSLHRTQQLPLACEEGIAVDFMMKSVAASIQHAVAEIECSDIIVYVDEICDATMLALAAVATIQVARVHLFFPEELNPSAFKDINAIHHVLKEPESVESLLCVVKEVVAKTTVYDFDSICNLIPHALIGRNACMGNFDTPLVVLLDTNLSQCAHLSEVISVCTIAPCVPYQKVLSSKVFHNHIKMELAKYSRPITAAGSNKKKMQIHELLTSLVEQEFNGVAIPACIQKRKLYLEIVNESPVRYTG